MSRGRRWGDPSAQGQSRPVGARLEAQTCLHALVVGQESVPTVAKQPMPFDGPAPPRGEPVGDLLLELLGEPVAQAILQLNTNVLVAVVLEAQHQLIKMSDTLCDHNLVE